MFGHAQQQAKGVGTHPARQQALPVGIAAPQLEAGRLIAAQQPQPGMPEQIIRLPRCTVAGQVIRRGDQHRGEIAHPPGDQGGVVGEPAHADREVEVLGNQVDPPW